MREMAKEKFQEFIRLAKGGMKTISKITRIILKAHNELSFPS